MISIELPFPDKALWPNGRAHWATKSRAFKKHKEWALVALVATFPSGRRPKRKDRIDWKVTVHPKTRHPIDDDNARASLKAYQDGMALALGVDDKVFAAPELTFGEPMKGGLVRIELG